MYKHYTNWALNCGKIPCALHSHAKYALTKQIIHPQSQATTILKSIRPNFSLPKYTCMRKGRMEYKLTLKHNT